VKQHQPIVLGDKTTILQRLMVVIINSNLIKRLQSFIAWVRFGSSWPWLHLRIL